MESVTSETPFPVNPPTQQTQSIEKTSPQPLGTPSKDTALNQSKKGKSGKDILERIGALKRKCQESDEAEERRKMAKLEEATPPAPIEKEDSTTLPDYLAKQNSLIEEANFQVSKILVLIFKQKKN